VLVLSSIVSSSHNGEAYLLCYPRSDQQKTLLHWAFLTARPWAEHGSRFTRGLLLLFFFVGDQTQTSARPNFESRNV